MLKKNLHFFSRYAILLLLLTSTLHLFACKPQEENYLSVLDAPLSFNCEISYNSKEIARALIEKTGDLITVRFTSPSALCGTVLTITQNDARMSYNGTELSPDAIPTLWLEISALLSKDKKIIAITCENEITEIHTENDLGTYDYKTGTNGELISADNGSLTLTVQKGN